MNQNQKCPLCDSEIEFSYNPMTVVCNFECKICGNYKTTQDLALSLSKFSTVNEKMKVSAYTRERQVHGRPDIIIAKSEGDIASSFFKLPIVLIDEVLDRFPKTVSERIDRALINMSKLSKFPGDKIFVTFEDYPMFFVDNLDRTLDAQLFILTQLRNEGYITGDLDLPDWCSLTAKGWQKVYELETSTIIESKQAFIAMWFDPSMDDVAEKGFKKAIDDAGYYPRRIDEKQHNEKIDDEIIAEIRRSRFVVCDFTGHRGGVYFEAGFAMGLGIPVIWTCREDNINSIHFDTRQYNHIVWKDEGDLHRKLLNRIRATIV